MSEEPRFAVGIDLGTTNSVLAAVDLHASEAEELTQTVLSVPQLVQPGAVASRPQLPSFVYLPHPDELAPGDLSLPWGAADNALGELARVLGRTTPGRLVASAKSWLSHAGVDRRAPLLPLEAEAGERISPLDASALYLRHLRAAWDHEHPDAPLTSLPLTLTVPASFDPDARELTVDAARAAGLTQAVLLEEPQAALYSWVQGESGWRDQVAPGDLILVVDVGGGTTDLSLIAVTDEDGELGLTRVAVGDHILLGGDNMDLALAGRVQQKLGRTLDLWQLQGLAQSCRAAKESLLAGVGADELAVVVPSRGSRLVGGTLKSELSAEDVRQTLLEGFFPGVAADAQPQQRARGALTKLGLPYAQDAAITRHLAAFLRRQRDAAASLAGFESAASLAQPSAVLFNGGVFQSPLLADRLLTVLNGWLQRDGAAPARQLAGADLDLAVARGAAYYGYARRGNGIRIRGGTAKSYYVGVESSLPAVPGLEPPLLAMCIAPFGMEEGSEAESTEAEFGLVVGEPVQFRFFGSSTRREDAAGTVLERWDEEELEELAEIGATLPAAEREAGEIVPVTLRAAVSELGTLQLQAVARDSDDVWKVEFDTRALGEAGEQGERE